MAVGAGPAKAAIDVESFSLATVNSLDGTSEVQAGAHADLDLSLSLREPGASEAAKDLLISPPLGLFVYADAMPLCGAAAFGEFECPSSTQAGLATVRAGHEGDPRFLLGTAPVYSLAPGPGELARFGFIVPTLDTPVTIPVSVRPGTGYGLGFAIQGFTEQAPLASLGLSLWAAPANPAHDDQRLARGAPSEPAGCPGVEAAHCEGGVASPAPPLPLLRNPTTCSGSATSTLEADSYEDPGDFSSATSNGLAASGCDSEPFSPSLTVGLTTAEARTASGLTLNFRTPGSGARNPSDLTESDVKSIVAALPPGLTINRGAFEVSGECTEADLAAIGSGCPESSKIGSFEAQAVGLEAPLEGSIYSGGLEGPGAYRLFLLASSPAMSIALIASLGPGPEAGQASISIEDLPQLPFEGLTLRIPSGPAFFTTPGYCGAYEARGVFAPWSAPSEPFVASGSVNLDSGPGGGPCPGPAESVAVSLSPASIATGGSSTSTATATVTDADGYGIYGDEMTFSSSDPGERIGAVTDNGDGTYSARITSSTTPGIATITAVDESVEPEALGTARLTQTTVPAALPSATLPQPLSSTPPVVRLLKRPGHRTRDRTPTFRFASSQAGSTFSCEVDGGRYGACASPFTLPKLGFGRHAFEVRATGSGGLLSRPAAYGFVVVRHRGEHQQRR
jgi:invasin-like protein